MGDVASSSNFRSGAALMIGIGDYPSEQGISKLPCAAHDAETMAALFTDPTVCNFAPDKIQLLVDSDATREKIVRALSNWLPEHSRGTDLAIIYIAGHGVLHRHGVAEEGYFLSYDAATDNVAANGISMRDIARWVDGIESSAIVVFLDCCHAGKAVFLRDGSISDNEHASHSVVRKLGFGPVAFSELTGRRRFVIASCDEGQASIESSELGHGLFTYHLLNGISGAADTNGDRRVDATELFNYVSDAVARDARERFGHEQKPWTHATWADKVYISYLGSLPRKDEQSEPEHSVELDELWLRNVERQLVGASDEYLLSVLTFLSDKGATEGVTAIFHCLAHQSETVRLAAKKTLEALRWSLVSAQIRLLAEIAEEDRMGFILEGLAAIEANKDVVALLDSLVTLLTGNLWQRAVFLLERKRLGLTLESVAELFREKASPYELCEVLGAGLFTAAYLATRRSSQLKFVVRVLRPEFASNPRVRQAFLDTSQHSFEFHHQSLVLTRDFGGYPDKALYYVVRDHVDGPTLRDVLAKGRRFEPIQCIRLLQQIVAALRPFHDRSTPLLHGGIKPSNIFLARDGKIILGDPSMPVPPPNTDLERLAYDFRYVAPEAFRTYLSGFDDKRGQIGYRADYYSFGCLAYEVFCGVAPFVAENQYELYAKHDRDDFVPPDRYDRRLGQRTVEFLAMLLAKLPEDRFSAINQIEYALDSLRHDFDAGSDSDGDERSPPLRPILPSGEPGIDVIDEDESSSATNFFRIIDDASLARCEPNKTLLSVDMATVDVQPRDDVRDYAIPPRYKMIEILGEGGFGRVYKAFDTALHRYVAIKTFRASRTQRAFDFIVTEAKAVASLSHPGIVRVYDVGTLEEEPYIVMEYIAGLSLSEVLKAGPMEGSEVARLIGAVAEALSCAHNAGVVHRDIKPGNILLDEYGTPKLCDFGLAKIAKDDTGGLSTSFQIAGTPAFMSPEQWTGDTRLVGFTSDIYSLGCVMYKALTGALPFQGSVFSIQQQIQEVEPTRPTILNPTISRDLEVVCLKCLEKEPQRRYQSARSLADDLYRFSAGEAVSSRPIGGVERMLRWCRRNPMRAALVVMSVIATAAIATVGALLLYR